MQIAGLGVAVAGRFLQQCLNAFNDNSRHYPQLVVDGKVGRASIGALQAFLRQRGADGRVVLLRALNSLQGARYISITEGRPENGRFTFGWFLHRVKIGISQTMR